ncbi:hypothetical protein ACW0JT_05665 [Arthrobacter sp. SA17]
MKQILGAGRRGPDDKKVVSSAEAVLIVLASAAAAVATTVLAASEIVRLFTGPVTLTLPLATRHQSPTGLRLGAQAHFTSVEAVIPAVPSGEASLLAWAGALNQMGVLAVLGLIFLLALRLRSGNLFTAGSVWILGSCGFLLTLAGTFGQLLDSAARNRLAELIGANQRTADEAVPVFTSQFDTGPTMAGIVLILLAAVFQFGRRLQKDTEGLI